MRARVLSSVVVLAVALTGCNGGGDDNGPPTTLPPVTPAASPTEAAGDVPAEATEATPEGAVEFVRYFYDVLERAYAEQDPEALRSVVAPECETCERIMASLTRLREEGLDVNGHTITVTDAVAPATEPNATSTGVTAILTFSEYVETAANGDVVYREDAAEQVVQDVALRRQGHRWLVAEVTES